MAIRKDANRAPFEQISNRRHNAPFECRVIVDLGRQHSAKALELFELGLLVLGL